MNYYKFDLKTSTQAEELLAYNLNIAGIEGVEIINKTGISNEDKKSMFIDITEDIHDDGVSILRFFIEEDKNIEDIKIIVYSEIDKIKEFFDVGDCTLTVEKVSDEEWKDKWKEFLKPFTIDDVLITPTWIETDSNSSKYLLKIDPGSAFGTGLHETTRLCVREIRKRLEEGMSFLDIGCGSAILSILAAKMKADKVVAIDIDENAINTAKENFAVNDISESTYELYCGNIIEDAEIDRQLGYGKYDIIAANLLAEIIVMMADCFIPHLKNTGILITSGILKEKKDKVIKSLEDAGFNNFETNIDGDWISIIASR